MPKISRARVRALPNYIRNLIRLLRALVKQGAIAPRLIQEFQGWVRYGYVVPAPQPVKWQTLRRYGLGGIWIETGTYRGETTTFLATISTHTYSIEPEPTLAHNAISLFRNQPHVTIIEGISEVVLPELLNSICEGSKPTVSFWLDGHYSKDMSPFKGPSDTPVVHELAAISAHLQDFEGVSILIDDMRCFDPQDAEFATYPKKSYLVNWAESHKLFWTIEHDIFIATSKPTSAFLS